MTTEAVLNGTYKPQPINVAKYIFDQIPDSYKEEFGIKLGLAMEDIIIIGRWDRNVYFKPNEQTHMSIELNNDEEDPAIKSIFLANIGKFSITMSIDPKPEFTVWLYP